MRTPTYSIRAGLAALVIAVIAVGFAPARAVVAQTGPFSAQIQLAIRALLASNAVVSGNWTCTGTCTGFGGGGGGIGGSIANQQVAVGTGANTIGGSDNFRFDGSTAYLTDGTSNVVQLSTAGSVIAQKVDETGAANLILNNATYDGGFTATVFDNGDTHFTYPSVVYTSGALVTSGGANATMTTNTGVPNTDLVYLSAYKSIGANFNTVEYLDPGAPDAVLSLSQSGAATTVHLATDGGGAITTTANDIADLFDNYNFPFGVTSINVPSNAPGSNGSGVVPAMSAQPFSGGYAASDAGSGPLSAGNGAFIVDTSGRLGANGGILTPFVDAGNNMAIGGFTNAPFSNGVYITGNSVGQPVEISVQGNDADINMNFIGKGLGTLAFSAYGAGYTFDNSVFATGNPTNLAPTDSFDTSGNWDVGANWTLGAGAVHAPGDTAALTNTSMDPIIPGKSYWVKISNGGGSAGTVTVFLGGTEVFTVDTGFSVVGFMTRAASSDPLTFVPTSDYDGTLSTVVVTLETAIATFTPNATTNLLFPDPLRVNQLGGLQIGNDSAAAAFGYVPTSSQILVSGTLVGNIWPEIAISGLTTQGAILSLNSNASPTHFYQWPTGTNSGVFQLDVNMVGGFSIDPSTGAIAILGTPKFAALTGAGNLPACLAADGTVSAGSNTAGVLSCP